jgi:hypothetical protein
MKRSADKADLQLVASAVRGRATRSTARTAELERDRLEQEEEQNKTQLKRAKDLTATPLLQALPLILTSGFLYKHEIRSAALVSKSWKSIWVEAQHELLLYCQVEVKVDLRGVWPFWARMQGLQNVIPTQAFSRTIFKKLCDLKVAAEKTERKKQQVRDTLPKWGVDFVGIRLHNWEANVHNGGSIYFAPTNHYIGSLVGFPQAKLRGWGVRLDEYLMLWTWDAFRKWKQIYNGKPLWEREILADSEHDEPLVVPSQLGTE